MSGALRAMTCLRWQTVRIGSQPNLGGSTVSIFRHTTKFRRLPAKFWLSTSASNQSKQSPYTIRPMVVDDIPKLHALLAENKWNMEMDYLKCVFSTDPSGLLVVVDTDDQVIGHNGILPHGNHLASSGMNVVKHGYREKGIGRDLFNRVMEVMGSRNVGGTALSNRITFYEQFGWTIPSFTLHYNQGKINPNFLEASTPTADVEITLSSNVNLEDIVNYDAGLHTVPRKRYLTNWINHITATCFVALRYGRVVGYCVLRPADMGWKIMPLYADDKHIAHALFCRAADKIPEGDDVIFTQPIENEHATEFVKGNNLTNYLSMTRLYNKWPVSVDTRRVYSVSSTEYGIV